MTERLPPLDHRWIEWLRSGGPAPPEARARVRAKLEAAIPSMRRGGGTGGGVGGEGVGSAVSLAGRTLIVAAFVAGAVAGGSLYASLARRPAPPVVYADRLVPAVRPTPPEASAPVAPRPGTMAMTLSPAAASASHDAPPRAPSSRSSRHSPLFAERVLLDDARGALVRGEPERALDRLGRHRLRFPNGLLSEERDAMEIEALIQATRYDEARARADDFRKRVPSSLFSSTVESAIDSAP